MKRKVAVMLGIFVFTVSAHLASKIFDSKKMNLNSTAKGKSGIFSGLMDRIESTQFKWISIGASSEYAKMTDADMKRAVQIFLHLNTEAPEKTSDEDYQFLEQALQSDSTSSLASSNELLRSLLIQCAHSKSDSCLRDSRLKRVLKNASKSRPEVLAQIKEINPNSPVLSLVSSL